MSSLFNYPDIYIDYCKRYYDLIVSKEFVACADIQLSRLFEKQVGFGITKRVSVGWASKGSGEYFLHKGMVTSFASNIWINNQQNNVVIHWRSKSGRIYDTADTDIDCGDLEFWFEGLDPLLYNKQMFPKTGMFQMKNLSYELEVKAISIDCILTLTLKDTSADSQKIVADIDTYIDGYNTKSEKNDRKDGLVHNWKSRVEDQNIIFEIDLGSGGLFFLKRLLSFLSKMTVFSKVEIL